MIRKLKAPSPALVIACIALFVALGGTAIAAAPPVKRALFANNAGKLQGRTARQVAALPGPATYLNGMTAEEIAGMPSPATTASALVTTSSAPFALAPGEQKDFSAQCAQGQKAVSGGYTTANAVWGADTRPTATGTGWTVFLVDDSSTLSATGNVHVVCLS
jgi:hypothetical protein